jgi:hypothetical protein
MIDMWKNSFWMLFGYTTFWFVLLAPMILLPKENKGWKNWWRYLVCMLCGCLWFVYLPMEAITRSGIANSVGDDSVHSLFVQEKQTRRKRKR